MVVEGSGINIIIANFLIQVSKDFELVRTLVVLALLLLYKKMWDSFEFKFGHGKLLGQSSSTQLLGQNNTVLIKILRCNYIFSL